MRNVDPGDVVKLWVVYQENGQNITGLTDLKIQILDQANNILLNNQSLTESLVKAGEYYYNWDTSSISVGTYAYVYYIKGTDMIDVEEFYFTYTEDQDGHAS